MAEPVQGDGRSRRPRKLGLGTHGGRVELVKDMVLAEQGGAKIALLGLPDTWPFVTVRTTIPAQRFSQALTRAIVLLFVASVPYWKFTL